MAKKQGSSPKLKRANGPRKAEVAKAGRRSGSSQQKPKGSIVRPDQTYTHGRAVDVLKSRCDEMSRILQWKMHSPSPKIDRALESAMEVYLDCFADIKWRSGQHPRDRHAAAVMNAVRELRGTLRSYAIKQLNVAFRETRPIY